MDKFILDGHTPIPADLQEWAKWYETNRDTRRVGRTEISEGVSVSTVFLALDHSFGDGPPVLFETMIFGGPHDDGCWRYCTWEEAEAGHARVVKALQDGVDPYEKTEKKTATETD